MSTSTAHAGSQSRSARLALTASAALLTLFVLFRAGAPGPAPAYAGEMTIKGGDLSAMTTDSNGREFLFIIDDRTETLLIYNVDRDGLTLRERQNLSDVFTAARGQSTGGRGVRR